MSARPASFNCCYTNSTLIEAYPLVIFHKKLACHELIGVHDIQQLLPGGMFLVEISSEKLLQ